MGLERLKQFLGCDFKSRCLDQQVTIAQLRDNLHLNELKIDFLEKTIGELNAELKVQKNATANMWTFIQRRSRLDMPTEAGSIRDALKKMEIR